MHWSLQLVDVGYNKLFKSRTRMIWMNWMIVEGVLHDTTSSLMRAEVLHWILLVERDLNGFDIVRNT
jgi:hypothetical protein